MQTHCDVDKTAFLIHKDVKEEVSLASLHITIISLEVSLNEGGCELNKRLRFDMLHSVARTEDINNLVSFISRHRPKQGILEEVLLDMSPDIRLD